MATVTFWGLPNIGLKTRADVFRVLPLRSQQLPRSVSQTAEVWKEA